MVDEEKVKKGLEMCSRDKWSCTKCPYFVTKGEPKCMTALGQDALKLIKKQQDIIDTHKANLEETLECLVEKTNVVRCKDCENFVWNSISQNAGSCGIGIGDGRNNWHSKDWFCANGKRKQTD